MISSFHSELGSCSLGEHLVRSPSSCLNMFLSSLSGTSKLFSLKSIWKIHFIWVFCVAFCFSCFEFSPLVPAHLGLVSPLNWVSLFLSLSIALALALFLSLSLSFSSNLFSYRSRQSCSRAHVSLSSVGLLFRMRGSTLGLPLQFSYWLRSPWFSCLGLELVSGTVKLSVLMGLPLRHVGSPPWILLPGGLECPYDSCAISFLLLK